MEVPGCCPNLDVCKLFITTGFTGDEGLRKNYIQDYCHSKTNKWDNCKRWIVKNKFNFCPDFVLPDTDLTPDEIIDKFDQEVLD